MIPFKKINFGNAWMDTKKLFDSGFVGLGNVVYEFETKLAQYVEAPEVVAVDSCTSALFLSLIWEKTRGIEKNEVNIPSMTVPLVACAINEAGLKISFNSQTDWVGGSYQLGNTKVFDSAHQLSRGQFVGYPDKSKLCFSFYPTKPIGSADGGAIATNDVEFAKWARKVIAYGRNQEQKYQNSWDFDVEMFGYKRHWTNLQAIVALEQLNRLDKTSEARRILRDFFNEKLEYKNTSEYLFRINVTNRNEFIELMKSKGIECGVHFKPLHLMTPFKYLPISDRDKSAVEEAYSHTVSIPFYEMLTFAEAEYIVKTILDSRQLIKKNE